MAAGSGSAPASGSERGAHAPEGEPLARRGVDKNNLAPSPFLRMFMYIIFKPILARQDQVRIVIELKRFFIVKMVKGTFWNFLVLYGKYEIELRIQ